MTKNISNFLLMTCSTQNTRLSYDGRYDNQGLQTKQLRNSALDIFPALQEHLSMHQLKIGRAVNFALQVNFCHVTDVSQCSIIHTSLCLSLKFQTLVFVVVVVVVVFFNMYISYVHSCLYSLIH